MKITNEDNMELMASYEDNYFDLAIVDPPYRDTNQPTKQMRNKINGKMKNFGCKPKKEFFKELFRVSKNQIVWGANYFVAHLQKGTKGWIVWDKGQHGLTMSDCELAYSSFNKPTRIFTFNRGLIAQKGGSIHPTQKPVELYRYLLNEYAEKGNKIFDSHLGSGSIAIACDDMKFDLVGCEIDKDYFEKAKQRIQNERKQIKLF